MNHSSSPSDQPCSNRAVRNVTVLGLALVAIFTIIFALSSPFQFGSESPRPILAVTGLLVAASVVAFLGLVNALEVPQPHRRKVLLVVTIVAVSLRLIAFFTCPILEIDYYRYLWDGKVVSAGISPYRYSPEEVINARLGDCDNCRPLERLSELSLRSQSNYTILSRIHFADHTTIYPPVSQCVFAVVMNMTAEAMSVQGHVWVIKLALLLFDLGTMVLVFGLLNRLKIDAIWGLVYAWNPLVIKEIANSGHLDSIATFFMMVCIVLLVEWRMPSCKKLQNWFLVGSAAALGLGVGAKLFPVVLLPALTIYVSRKSWGQACLFLLLFSVIAGLLLVPMLSPVVQGKQEPDKAPTVEQSQHKPHEAAVIAKVVQAKEKSVGDDVTHGAVGFFSSWRMNDTLFALVYFNLKHSERAASKAPWYVLTRGEFRESLDRWMRQSGFGGDHPAHLAARMLTMGVFVIFYGWQLLCIGRRDFPPETENSKECLFLMWRLLTIVTVFLFLQPTVNPWYLVWVIPLACFCENKGWLLVSGLMLTYYSRFWFESLSGPFEIFGRAYSGAGIYDHWIVWISTLLMLIVLWQSADRLPKFLFSKKSP